MFSLALGATPTHIRVAITRPNGLVTRTMARLRLTGKMADDDLVRPPPIPACDHPARRLALSPLHAQLSRRRGSTRGARSGCLLRDGALSAPGSPNNGRAKLANMGP